MVVSCEAEIGDVHDLPWVHPQERLLDICVPSQNQCFATILILFLNLGWVWGRVRRPETRQVPSNQEKESKRKTKLKLHPDGNRHPVSTCSVLETSPELFQLVQLTSDDAQQGRKPRKQLLQSL